MKFKIIFCLLFVVFGLSACQSADVSESVADLPKEQLQLQNPVVFRNLDDLPPDISQIIEKGKIVFGFAESDRPPFYMTNEQGEFYGIDVDIAKDIAAELGVEAVFDRTSTTYAELYQKIIDGEVDIVVAKFSRTLNRALFISYTEPYAKFARTVMLSKTNEISLGIEGNPMPYLKSNPVKIAVISGTSFVEYAKSMFPLAELVEVATIEEGIEKVNESNVTAFLYDELEFARIVGVRKDIMLYASIYIIDDMQEYICMAVPSQSQNLREWLNVYIQNKNVFYSFDKMAKDYPEVFSGN